MGGGARKMRWLVSEFRCFVIVFSERVGLSKNNDVAKGCYQTIPLTWLCLSFSDSKEWAFFGLFENTDIRYILSQLIFSAETFWSIFMYVCCPPNGRTGIFPLGMLAHSARGDA